MLQNSHAAQWNELGLDAIICPVHFSNAPAIHEAQYSGYTNAFNLLDYTAAVFPVGKVEPSDTWENFPPAIEQSLGKEDDFSRKTYTGPEKYRGSPVSLQIVTRRLQEEKNLAIMEKVIQAIELKKQLPRGA
jgi:amidase